MSLLKKKQSDIHQTLDKASMSMPILISECQHSDRLNSSIDDLVEDPVSRTGSVKSVPIGPSPLSTDGSLSSRPSSLALNSKNRHVW